MNQAPTLTPGEPYSPYRLFLRAFVPLPVMAMTDLSPGAKLLFGRLAVYAGENTKCWPGLDRLAIDLGSCTDAVGRWLKELTDAELIRRTRKGPGKTAECEFIWQSSLSADSALMGNLDSAESRKLDSAEMGGKIPLIRGSDSAEPRNHPNTTRARGSVKRFRETVHTHDA